MRIFSRCFLIIALFGIWIGPLGLDQEKVSAGETRELRSADLRYAEDKWTIIPKLASTDGEQTVNIDGRLDESVWDEAPFIGQFKTAYFERSVDHIEYRLIYDDFYLYVGGVMSAEEAESLQKIEIMIKPSPERAFYYVASIPVSDSHPESNARLNTMWNPSLNDLSSDEGRVNLPVSEKGKAIVSGVVYDLYNNGTEVYVEVAIPLGFVARNGVETGDEWQLNIAHVHHLYTNPLTSWIPVRHANQWDTGHSERGGSIRFVGDVIGQGRMGSIFFGGLPNKVESTVKPYAANETDKSLFDLQLSYIDFTNKQLRFSISDGTFDSGNIFVQWQSPGKPWEMVPVSYVTHDDSSISVQFEHPKPMVDGIYRLMVQYLGEGDHLQTSIVAIDREYMVEAGLETIPPSSTQVAERKVEWREPSKEVMNVISLIPPQPGFRFSGLPELPELAPHENLYRVGPDVRSIIALPTGTSYLGEHSDFEDNKVLPFINRKGEESLYPYYEDYEDRRYYLTGLLWHFQKMHVVNQIDRLSSVDPLGAARVLYALAQSFDNWQITAQQRGSWFARPVPADSGPPYAYWGGLWNHFWWGELNIVGRLASAYQLIKTTNAFQLLSDEVGKDVEKKIVEDMLLTSLHFALSQPPVQGNLSSRLWSGLIEIGSALDDPDIVHRGIDLIRNYIDSARFLSDGFWYEITPSYHQTMVSGLNNAINLLQGWADPEGYVSPRTGVHFDGLDIEEEFPVIAKANELVRSMVYPDGKMMPITDTWPSTRVSHANIDTGPFLLPAAKIVRMAAGAGANQTQLNINFQPKYGHSHHDGINLTLYANGQELIPDLGYTLSKYRWFALSTMGHNTVVVDSANMSTNNHSRHGGNIETFVTSPLFQLTRASYDSAYPSVSEYARELWLIPFSSGDNRESYILDIFRVEGGRRHEYTLQGDANRDAVFQTDRPTQPYGPYLLPEGVNVTEPISQSNPGHAEGHYRGYIYVRDVDKVDVSDDQFSINLLVTQSNVEAPRLKITGLLDDDRNELFLGRSPSLRLARINGSSSDDNRSLDQYTMPKMVLRREGSNLRSDFVTVIEPFYDDETSRIDVIERLTIDDGPKGAVAARVIYGDTVDIILSNPHHDEGPLVAGDLELHGEYGFIRLRDGVIQEMKMVGGTLLKKGGAQLEGPDKTTGAVVSTLRKVDGDPFDGVVVDATVCCAELGQFMIISHPDGSTSGYQIGRIETDGDHTVIEFAEHDPGFVIDKDGLSRQPFHPWKEWQGSHSFEIAYTNRQTDVSDTGEVHGETKTMVGTVYDETGKPLPHAVVNVAGYSSITTISDEQGNFNLSGVPAGKQWLKASHDLYDPVVSGPWNIGDPSIERLSFTLSDRRPPTLWVSMDEVDAGESMFVTSNTDSTIYVLRGRRATNLSVTALKNFAVIQLEARADEQVSIQVSDEMDGDFLLYAVDGDGRISKGVGITVRNVEKEQELLDLLDAWMSGGS